MVGIRFAPLIVQPGRIVPACNINNLDAFTSSTAVLDGASVKHLRLVRRSGEPLVAGVPDPQ